MEEKVYIIRNLCKVNNKNKNIHSDSSINYLFMHIYLDPSSNYMFMNIMATHFYFLDTQLFFMATHPFSL